MTTLGGIRDVEEIQNSVEIENLARFAVEEYKKKRVISAKKQVVAGTLYYITLEATDGGEKKIYETKVLEKPWLNFKEVQEFKLVADVPSVSTT
ncbi:Proteinase inhibitor I25, cystatin, conserved site [Sesbania bispinosa]|nr:Proteinase inhibitor I25, cystatin, conserved site [Sesbania bispinosa]